VLAAVELANGPLAGAPFAALLAPIVVHADGWIVPLQYGFSPRFAIASLDAGDFGAQASRWVQDDYAEFLALTRAVWDEMEDAPAHLPFSNWYARISGASHHWGAVADAGTDHLSLRYEQANGTRSVVEANGPKSG
jgi:hypothetical protein